MRGRKKRTLVIGILCCLLVFMGVGFAVMNTTINIGGTSTAINTWSILIESITEVEGNTTNGNSVSAKVLPDKVSAQFVADFKAPGDYVEYNVKVVNNGSIDATLKSITLTPTGTDAELFSFENTAVQGSKLEAGASTEFTVKITFKSEATKLPDEDVTIDLVLNYVQGDGTEGGENTPGGDSGTDTEGDWLYEVDESGTITAYNYNSSLTENPQNVVVPAEVNGVEVTTITEQSFTPKGNVEMYYNESPTGMYVLIHETEPNFTNILNKLVAMFTMECDGDASCEEQYKSMLYACKDSNTCYNALNIEQNAKDSNIELTITSMPETVQSQGGVYIIPDPDVPLEESMVELKPTVSSLDLSNATNLTTIEDNALSDVGLESVDFGDNSSVTTIGNNAFSGNNLTEVEIPSSVETIGNNAFSSNQIETLTFETEGTVENQLTKNNKYSLTKLGTTASKLATTLKGVKSIGESAFYNNKISELEIPSTVKTIGTRAFENNQISKNLVISGELTSIGMYVFAKNLIEEVSTIQASENVISLLFSTNYTFKDNFLTSLTIPDYITHIGTGVFENNKITGELALSDNIQNVNSYAFRNNLITSLVLEKIIPTNHTNYATSFSGNEIETLKIKQCTITSCVESFWDAFTEQVDSVKKLVISSGEIGEKAFYALNNPKLETLILEEGVTKISDEAFAYNSITELVIPASLSDIGAEAFYANKISELYYPKTVENLGENAFSHNPFDELIIEELNSGVPVSSSDPFGYNIKELTIESGSIPTRAFQSAEIEKLTIGRGVTSIGSLAFNSSVLRTIVIKRTEEDFLANVTVATDWYDNSLNPTITYDPS